MSLSIGQEIYNILNNDLELNQLVEGGIYPIIAKVGANYPYIIYKRESFTPLYTKDIHTQDIINVSIMCVSETYSESIDIIERIYTLLENKRTNKIRSIIVESATEDFISDVYIQTLNIKITI